MKFRFCRDRSCGTDRLQRRHPVFDHGRELHGFFAMIGPRLGAAGAPCIHREGDLDAGLEGALKARFLDLPH